VRFEWDPGKSQANRRKHGVSFSQAKTLFESGVDFLEIYDQAHSTDEDRFVAIGPVEAGIVVVVWTEREETPSGSSRHDGPLHGRSSCTESTWRHIDE